MCPGISRRDFFPSFYEILSEMLLNLLVLLENLALHTSEVSIFCLGNIIFSYFTKKDNIWFKNVLKHEF